MKKLTSVALLSLSLILASCGGTTNTPATSSEKESEASDTTSQNTESSAPETSSAPAEKTLAEKLADLFSKMASTGNATFSLQDSGYTYQYFGDDSGMLVTVESDSDAQYTGYGISKVANVGLISYYYVNDTAGVDPTTASVVSPNKNIKFSDYDNSIIELGECGKVVTFSESARTHTFSTSDEDFVNALLTMLGGEDYIGVYPTVKASVKLDEATSEMTLSFTLDGHATQEKISVSGLVISNVGTTKNKNVTDYLATNPTFTAPTAWSAGVTSYLSSLGITNLPLPTGLTYAASMGDGSSELLVRDLGSGNKSSTYGNVLTGLGYTLDSSQSGTSNGVTYMAYGKAVTSTNPLIPSSTTYIILAFQAATADTRTMYPNGVFAVYATSVETGTVEDVACTAAQLDTVLAQYKCAWAPTTRVFPALNFAAGYTQITYSNITTSYEEYMNSYYEQNYGSAYADILDCKLYAEVCVYYATEAEATAACTAIGTQLVAAGYAASTSYSGYWTLEDPTDTTYYYAAVSAEAYMGNDSSNPSYQGYALLTFEYSTLNV